MLITVAKSFETWITAQTQKSMGRNRGIDNISFHGINRLRELILELAFSGKLCENSKEIPNFTQIFNSIKKERELYHKERNVRIQKFEPLQIQLKEFKFPKNWTHVYLDDIIVYITDFQSNGSFATLRKNVQYYDEENYAVLIRLTDLRHNLEKSNGFVYTDEKGYKFLAKSFVNGGELVVANVGAGVGTTIEIPVINRPATLAPNMFMVVLTKDINKDFFKYFSKSPRYWDYINEVNVGTGQPKINKKEYKSCKIPFPPIEEQQRIVAKVDELMALCDKLEQQQTGSLKTHQLLVETLLKTLTDAKDVAELNKAWQQIEINFSLLFTTEESVDLLKQTILQLAVMGKLTQDFRARNPELVSGANSARELLKKITAEKEKLIAEGKIKRQNPFPKITDDERPFELPLVWKWVRWNELLAFDDGAFKRGPFGSSLKKDMFVDSGYKVYEQYCPINDDCSFERYFITNEMFENLKTFAVKANDFLISCSGATLGRITQIPEVFKEGIINQALLRVRINHQYLNYTFFKYLFKSPYFQKLILDNSTGSAIPNVKGVYELKSMPIPLLTIAEQHQIVAKVDELFSLCDALKERINESQEIKVKLADAVVEVAVKDKPAGKVIYTANEQMSIAAEPE